MKINDVLILIEKAGYKKAKHTKWMELYPTSKFFGHPTLGTRVELNSATKTLKRLNDYAEVYYMSSTIEIINKLLAGEHVTSIGG